MARAEALSADVMLLWAIGNDTTQVQKSEDVLIEAVAMPVREHGLY
ncbi:MAG: hypothetical protein ACRD5K_02950 [Candidatus Acidiferrales bacterium]